MEMATADPRHAPTGTTDRIAVAREPTASGGAPADDACKPQYSRPRPRPQVVPGVTARAETPNGTLFVTLNRDNGGPLEVFVRCGKAGSDIEALAEAIGRLVSLALRCGVDPHEIIDQMEGIGGRESVGFGKDRVRSIPDALARLMKQIWFPARALDRTGDDAREAMETTSPQASSDGRAAALDLCPECGNTTLVFAEGCCTCLVCGFSRC
jgi:ribonucleoside-diphosphate reductase alpha chain